MEAVFQVRRDTTFRLLTSARIDGALSLDHYLTAVPVRVQASQVEICFITRWNVNVSRFKARGTTIRPQPQPGEAGYRRFRNLKLTIGRDDPVRIRRYDPTLVGSDDFLTTSDDVIIKVLDLDGGKPYFSISGPSDQIVDLSQFESQQGMNRQGLNLREIVDRLNHGDVWDRSDVL
jgi:hypothetical protein